MTTQRSNSQPKLVERQNVLRLAGSRRSESAPALPKDGIRPTRKGPWDPCRFQEYEISPEFRRQIMLAKPPPADPRIFQDTPPPTDLTATVQPGSAAENARTVSNSMPVQRQTGRNIRVHGRLVQVLIVAGALLGLIAGYRLSLLKTRGTSVNTDATNASLNSR